MEEKSVKQALSDIAENPTGFAILDLAEQFFCSQTQSISQSNEATKHIIEAFCDQSRALQDRINAGIICIDIFQLRRVPVKQDVSEQDLSQIQFLEKIFSFDTKEPKLKKIQSRLLAIFLEFQVRTANLSQNANDNGQSQNLEMFFQAILSDTQDGSAEKINFALSILYFFFTSLEEKVQDQELIKQIYPKIVPMLMPMLLETFTNEEITTRDRSHILYLIYIMIRGIAWADGLDNELIENCLGETFGNWMAILLQIIQSNASKNVTAKINALRCLTVIFRDLVNYSRNSINIILKPAWKLLNSLLPVYTESVGYNNNENNSDDEENNCEDSWEDELDKNVIKSLAFHTLELLSSLVQRPNVQQIVQQGLVPLVATVSSYLIVEASQEQEHRIDQTFFLSSGIENLNNETIRNKCLQLVSNLIEVFQDESVGALLLFIQNICIMSTNDKKSVDLKQEDDQKVKSAVDQDAREFQALLQEMVYLSDNRKHPWKRREIGMLLMGVFAEDIKMFAIKNPSFNFVTLITNILSHDFTKVTESQSQKSLKLPQSLLTHIKGRMFGSCSAVTDILNIHDSATVEFMKSTINSAIKTLNTKETPISVKLVATRCFTKYLRKLPIAETKQVQLKQALDSLLNLIDSAATECIHLPIDAFTVLSKVDEELVSEIAHKVTPKMLNLFNQYHSDVNIGNELITLFKVWCKYDKCKNILIDTFIPFIQNIILKYYNQTQGNNQQQKVDQDVEVVDSSIFTHCLDLLCTLLKFAKETDDKRKIVQIFPKLLEYLESSEDMFMLMQGTTTLKTFIHFAAPQIKEISTPENIIKVAKKLLDPKTNEQAGVCLGNLVIQIIHKIQPMIDTSLLMCVVQKIYKSRMPSIVQSLVLVFARLIQTNPKEIVTFLSETSIDNRICLKIVLDKWLLQQPLFRGNYTRTVTLISLMSLLLMRDPRLEILMVIGYNPSHSNVNSEVNAPFKILSTLLRFIDVELKPTNKKPLKPVIDIEEVKESGGMGGLAGYKFQRTSEDQKDQKKKQEEVKIDSGMRMDTIGGDEESDQEQNRSAGYLDREEDDYQQRSDDNGNSEDVDKLSVDLDDLQDEDSDEVIDLSKDDRKNHSLQSLAYNQNSSSGGNSTEDSAENQTKALKIGDLFTVSQSNDKGLADMETGSEVYMSELLAGFDMEDIDDAEEANEEDLVELGDKFAQIKIVVTHIQETINQYICSQEDANDYLYYCVQQLPADDQELAKEYLKLKAFNKAIIT